MRSRWVRRGWKLLGTLMVVGLAGTAAQLLARRRTSGDESSDTFSIAAIMNGREFESRARGLRSGSALAVMGGAELDLRKATLGPGGATLDLTAVMGGVEVRLAPDWNVDVHSHGPGGLETWLTDAAELPSDAATLRLKATTWFGGIEIRQDI